VKAAAALPLVLAAAVSAAQPLGNDFRVNSKTTGEQVFPAVAIGGADGGGTFVVVWQDGYGVGADTNVFARLYDFASGNALSAPFEVNAYTTGPQLTPSVAASLGPFLSTFVVTWHSKDQTGTYAIYAARFDQNASRSGSEFRVSTITTASTSASVASDPAGGFCVVWNANPAGIFARRYDGGGTPRGSDFRVSSTTSQVFAAPRVAADGVGGFEVSWDTVDVTPTVSHAVWSRRVSSSGDLGPEVLVAGPNGSGLAQSSAPPLAFGSFLVSWIDFTGSKNVVAQKFGVQGVPLAGSFRVNGSLGSVSTESTSAAAPDGPFVVVWGSSSGSHVLARQVTRDGAPGPAESQVDTTPFSSPPRPAVAAESEGYVVTWMGSDGDARGIYARRFRTARVAGDVNADGIVNVQDVFQLINFLFAGGPAPI
jgi:hypothetical protein